MSQPVIKTVNDHNVTACEMVISDIFQGSDLADALKDIGLSPRTFYETVEAIPELGVAYARAKQFRAELMANEIVSIADTEPDAQKARNRITARQWYASKVYAKVYGDKLDVNINQTVDIGSALLEARQRAQRPVSDQLEHDTAETVEFTELAGDSAPDTQSDTAISDPGKQGRKGKKGSQ